MEDNFDHKVSNKSIFEVCDAKGEGVFKNGYDLAYFDPPYGTANIKTPTSRVRYFSYYHLWTTVIKNDKPTLMGAAKRREDVSSDSIEGAVSVFESTSKEKVMNAFSRLVKTCHTRYALFSYSNRSKLTIRELIAIIEEEHTIIKVLSFKHAENSQANTLINSEYKTFYEEENLEYLILSKNTPMHP